MKKSCILQLEGGIGKHIAATSLISKLKTLYENIYVFSAYPEIFFGLANRSFNFEVPYGFEDYFKKADDIFFPEPYRNPNFRNKKIGLCESFFQCCNIEYNEQLPTLIFNEADIELAKKIKKDIGTFIIVQFHGGISPYNDVNKPISNINIVKNYSTFLSEKLVLMLKEKYAGIQIVNFALPNENKINGTLELQLGYKQWFALLQEAETFISIDSTLQHAGAAINKKGFVLWGGTDPKMYGYNIHENIIGDCEDIHCTRPYFVPSSDIVGNIVYSCPSKKCMNIQPEKILEKIKLNIKNIEKPTIDINNHICKGC